MSAPNDEGNPWLSLADLLQNKKSVANLATSIEKSGIQTYDRFGRRIAATDECDESKAIKAKALDLLAGYYAYLNDSYRDRDLDPDAWFEYNSPLIEFGWPADESPDFEKNKAEEVPGSVKTKKRDHDALASPRLRRTYLTIIASLCKRCNIEHQTRGASQRIMEATDKLGFHVDDGTIQSMLKEIPEALESRMK
jgi:hypothetical protein